MKNKVFIFGSKLIKYLFYFLFLLTCYFAITSPNLILGDNNVTGSGTTIVTALFIITALIVIGTFLTFESWADLLKYIFIDRQWVTSITLLSVVVIIQIVFVLNVHPAIGFDPGAIHRALIQTTDIETRAYFSLNMNNIATMLWQHQLALFFKNHSWLLFDLITLFFVDLSAVLNICSVLVIDPKKVPLAIYMHALWLSVFPMIIVPYTDAWVLPFVSMYIFLYCLLRYGKLNLIWKSIVALLLGITVAGTYFIKPSAIIGIIAIGLIELLYLFKGKFSRKKMIVEFILGLIILIGAVPTYSITNYAIDHQKYIKVNAERAIVPLHFISMGVSGDGGYNAHDALMMAKMPSKQAQTAYSKKMLEKRLQKKGFWGYLKFLLQKHANNTADGTFAWIKEGHFISDNPKPSSKGLAGKIRNFVYLYGKNLGDFRYIAQVWWVFLLATILFNWKDDRKIVQLLRLTIIGGFMFLLIFEGGRSRYLIQFLSAFLILSALSWSKSWQKLTELFAWAKL